jgi:hypothetical protein
MRPPVRDVDKSVEILLQQLARIGFQVSPFVVVRVTERFSKFEIQRELDFAGAGSGNRLPKSGYRSQT